MECSPLSGDEDTRLDALEQLEILDTAPEPPFDDLARLAAIVCNTPAGFISFIDRDRQWFKASHGFPAGETARQIAFCNHTIEQPGVMVVPDARVDERFQDNPLVRGNPPLVFYAAAPLLTAAGVAVGTIAVIDHVPRQLAPAQEQALAILARQVVTCLILRARLRSEAHRAGLQIQTAAQQGLERFRALVEHSPDAFALLAPDGTVLYVSPASRRTMGYPLDAISDSAFLYAHPEDAEAVKEAFAESIRRPGEVVTFETRGRHRDGSWRTLEVQLINHLDNPQLQAIVANYRDVTEHRAAESRTREQLLELQRWHEATLGREERILELKQEVNDLLREMNRPPRYAHARAADRS